MKPEITTKTSTRMLMTVKILFIMVDSFTPNASTPFEKRRVQGYRDDNDDDGERGVVIVITLCKRISASTLPESSRTNTVAKISGYGARPVRPMAAFS